MREIRNMKKIYNNNSFLSQNRSLQIKSEFDELNFHYFIFLIERLSIKKQMIFLCYPSNKIFSSVLLALSLEKRKIILNKLSSKELIEKIFSEINFYDAINIMNSLSIDKKNTIINKLKNKKYGKKILSILNYEYNYHQHCVGDFIEKKIVQVDDNLTIFEAIYVMRKQAESMTDVYAIYVVDSNKKLLGLLSLNKLLTTSICSKINKIFNPKVHFVTVDYTLEKVKKLMNKYNLIEVPVIDKYGILLGKITLDHIINYKFKKNIQKEIRVTFNFFSDIKIVIINIFKILKSRLPWLLIGMFGGLIGSYIIQFNEIAMKVCPTLIFFIPLIAATAGNVGVQTSAIVVQGLASQQFKESIFINVCKEILIGLFSGSILSLSILVYNLMFSKSSSLDVICTISISLLLVIIFASCIGAFVPLFLNKLKINPAVATGPFITTSNDIFGILLYFTIAKLILKF